MLLSKIKLKGFWKISCFSQNIIILHVWKNNMKKSWEQNEWFSLYRYISVIWFNTKSKRQQKKLVVGWCLNTRYTSRYIYYIGLNRLKWFFDLMNCWFDTVLYSWGAFSVFFHLFQFFIKNLLEFSFFIVTQFIYLLLI